MKISNTFRATAISAIALSLSALATPAMADIIHADDVIAQFSMCVGNDCVNGENFGFDTLRLKENNLRIHFDDTSNSASFAQNDWRLVANDTSNGGANFFAIEDATAGRRVFSVAAGAPSNSLTVDSAGDVGIGIDNAIVELHVRDGDSPTVRLEQDGSSGFTPQTWDMAGNETNFFVRDVTNGSKLPFRIRPDAPTSSIDIAADGDIGIGTSSPQADLHVNGGAGQSFVSLRLEAPSASPNTSADFTFTDGGADGALRINIDDGDAQEMEINDDGNLTLVSSESFNFFRLQADGAGPNTQADITFTDGGASGFLRYNIVDGDGHEMELDHNGAMTILGALTENSDVNNKTAIVPVDGNDILSKVSALPISAWTYKHDAEAGVRHIGPMAQDFYHLFGTGATEKGISTIDTAGVALAAIQALTAENAELKARLDRLEAQIAE